MKVFILAGGLGTRLREIVGDHPKPMAPVSGKPFLAYVIALLREQGFRHFVLCVGYKAEQVRAHFGTGDRYGVTLDYVIEDIPLGTGGAIRNAREHIEGAFLLLNGDTYLDTDYTALVAHHNRLHPAGTVGTIGVRSAGDTEGRGVMTRDVNGFVQSFQEKSGAGPGWINAGVYVLEPALLETIPAQGSVSIERDVFPTLLAQGKRLGSCETPGYFVDIGTPQGYYQFQQYIEGIRHDHSE